MLAKQIPANKARSSNVGFMLAQCRRQWADIKPILGRCVVFAGMGVWGGGGGGVEGYRDCLIPSFDHVSLLGDLLTLIYNAEIFF